MLSINNPLTGTDAIDAVRERILRRHFTTRQWRAVERVLDAAPAHVHVDDLLHRVCAARLNSYRSTDPR